MGVAGSTVKAMGSDTGAWIVNVRLPDFPPAGVETLITAEPGLCRSPVVTCMRSVVEFTYVVVRATLFQRMTEPLTNPVPPTVIVNPPSPAVALEGERLRMTGFPVPETAGAGTDREPHAWSAL